MARPKNRTPNIRLHKASGQAFIEINGKRHYLGPYGTKASNAEYDRILAEYLASGRSPTYGLTIDADDGPTIAELLDAFLDYAAEYYGTDKSTSGYYGLKRAAKPLANLYADLRISEFGAVQFKAIRQHLINDGRCRTGINRYMRRILQILCWGVGEGMVDHSIPAQLKEIIPLAIGRTTAPEVEPVRPVEAATVEATLPHLSPVVRAMVEFQRYTGCRPGEVCILQPCGVDRTTGDVWEAKLTEHKTAHHGRERTIYIGPKAQSVLLPFLLRPADAYCFSPAEAAEWHRAERNAARVTRDGQGNGVGKNRRRKPKREPGERYTTQSYGVAIARVCRRLHPHPTLADVEDSKLTAEQRRELKEWDKRHRWSPNQLRHLAGTEIRRQFGLEAAQLSLGHAKADVTQVYAERDKQKAVEVARRIG